MQRKKNVLYFVATVCVEKKQKTKKIARNDSFYSFFTSLMKISDIIELSSVSPPEKWFSILKIFYPTINSLFLGLRISKNSIDFRIP